MTETPPQSTAPPLEWPDVLAGEYRELFGDSSPLPADAGQRLAELHRRLELESPTALTLSGGGIRSATFGLGVLQGLAHLGLLRRFDYLSTVSGGGYIGGFLSTWLHRHRTAPDDVERMLDPSRGTAPQTGEEPPPVAHVRQTCRYLAPRGGVVSADLWSVLATMGRNLLLNWLVILPLLAAALLVPRLFYAVTSAVESGLGGPPCLAMGAAPSIFLIAATVGFALAVGYIVVTFAGYGGQWSQSRFLGLFLAPLLLGSIAITLFWSAYPCQLNLGWTLALSAGLPALAWALIGTVARRMRKSADGDAESGDRLRVTGWFRPILAALLSGPIVGAGAYWFAMHPFGFGDPEPLRQQYAVFAVPLLLMLISGTNTLFVGLASGGLDDAALEWWSRASGWIGIAALSWLVAAVTVFYMADGLDRALIALDGVLRLDERRSASVFTALIPLLGSLAGLAARPAPPAGQGSSVTATLRALALPVIILALLSSLAWVNLRVLERLEYHRAETGDVCAGPIEGDPERRCHPIAAGVGETVLYGTCLLILGLGMSRFVPTNRFSLHGMYRQRLIRTFLGASRRDREPNAFTGFDTKDDLRVHELRGVKPFHVINATLNAVSATNVGRHERQSESFTFTPLHVGNTSVGYRAAAEYGSDGGHRSSGISLGMALAVSGAAASSSLGMYSSKSRAFLLTLANARLGLWFGNPRNATTWQQSDPPLGIGPLLRELLGLTTDHNPYVYLSDGGHYENLGLWEMVARRCRWIVVSDGGCDPGYTFGDLSNAVRRIRLDLGIPIEFTAPAMTRAGQGHGNAHAAIGTIHYDAVDGPGASKGTILYLKATLSGDEPMDVWTFAQTHPAFPHDSTADQFFDEARFESYRALGFHTVVRVAQGLRADASVAELVQHAQLHPASTTEHGNDRDHRQPSSVGKLSV